MDIINNANPKIIKAFKIAGVVLVAIIILTIILKLLSASLGYVTMNRLTNFSSLPTMSAPGVAYDYAYKQSEQESYGNDSTAGLSIRNVTRSIMPVPPYPSGGTTGTTAEQYEVTEYTATIETRHLEKTCGAVLDLKARDYVIFENSTQFDHGCNYVFKVKKANVAEIVAIIKDLDPKDLNENAYTIKSLVDDYTSETEILEKKLATIDDTLKRATTAYDEITTLATRVQDAESLAKIITSKITIIERLTQERLNISAQLERLSRSKADQLDRLEYTYFRVNIFENKFFDGSDLGDSWKNAVRRFVSQVNGIFQSITIGLLTFLFVILQFAIYIIILVILAKYGWKLVKYIWKGRPENI